MPILMSLYEHETDPLVFPLASDGLPYNLQGIDHLAIVVSGLDGKLQATVTSGSTVTVFNGPDGLAQWALVAGDLDARYSPYRVYFRVYQADGTYDTVPRGDYWLLQAADDLT